MALCSPCLCGEGSNYKFSLLYSHYFILITLVVRSTDY
jgi:hypothetical protein